MDQRVQQVEKQVGDLQAALLATRKTRNLLVLSLLAVLVVAGVLFYRLGQRLQSEEYQTELGDAAQEYLEQNSPEYMREVQMLVDHVGPKVSDAFMDQAKKDMPLYAQAVDRQRELLMKNLEERLAIAINDHYEVTLKQSEEILIQEFPAADDDVTRRRVMENFRIALNRMVAKFYIDEFRTELQALYDTWDGFPVASVPDEGDLPLEDQLFGTLLNLVSLKLSSAGTEQLAAVDPVDAAVTVPVAPTDAPEETPPTDKPDTPAPDSGDTTPKANPAPPVGADTPDAPNTTGTPAPATPKPSTADADSSATSENDGGDSSN